ncbi:MAG: hypothetical protein HQ521_21995, partial [Bacteroidetes bacterium]|nr:hypothetical protein [Bacteroidota bacterium]
MKKVTTILFALMLLGFQAFPQTFGLFADISVFKTGGDLKSDSRTPNGGYIADGLLADVVTDAENVYAGSEALHVQMFGNGGSRLYFTYNIDDTEAKENSADFSEWDDINAFLVFHVKLNKAGDFRIGLWSLRDGNKPDESDESAVKHGLDTTKVGKWQKIILPINDPFDGGHLHDYNQWASFTFRDRDNLADFYVDEVYVDYRPKTTFGIYADSSAFKLSGDLKTDTRSSNGGFIADGLLADPVTDPFGIYAGGEALQVQMFGNGGSRLYFAANIDDPEGKEATADFSDWNDMNAVIVYHVNLNKECDFRVCLWTLRNGEKPDESDESMVLQGLDSTKLGIWQKIVLPLDEGLEGNDHDFSQFASFPLRDRSNNANFLIDEIYVIYPTVGTGTPKMKVAGLNMLSQNYPNPFA